MGDSKLLGGRNLHYIHYWRSFTNDKTVLINVKGIELEFTSTPPRQHRFPCEICMSNNEMKFFDKKIKELLENGSISWVNNIQYPLSFLFQRKPIMSSG